MTEADQTAWKRFSDLCAAHFRAELSDKKQEKRKTPGIKAARPANPLITMS